MAQEEDHRMAKWRIYLIEGGGTFDEISGDMCFLSEDGVFTVYKKNTRIAVYPRGMWTRALELPKEEQ